MYLITIVISSLVMVGFLTSCKDDDYYEKPSWVGDPIYQELEKMGGFTHYLSCVDKTDYAQLLKGSGFYTAFVPTDEAFEIYMQKNNISSVDAISKELADKIVSYSLLAVASRSDEIDDYQRDMPYEERDKNLNISFKKATLHYKGVYETEVYGGDSISVIDVNVGSQTFGDESVGMLLLNDNNRKPVPFFTEGFLHAKGLTVSDYNFLYPEVEFSGFNVADSEVLEKDIRAENGIIHTVNKVLEPIPNLDEILYSEDDNSAFKDIIDKYVVKYYTAPREIILNHEKNTGVYKDIYIRDFTGMHIQPNAENYLMEGGVRVDNQIDGWTMFAPTNNALNQYFQDVFLAKGYKSLDEMPKYVINEFVNAHMFRTTVWPSKFATTQNHFGESARFDKDIDVEKSIVGSNGLFYSVNKVQETDAFSTVYRDILLDPEYTVMYRALVATENNFQLRNKVAHQQVFLINNQQFEDLGISYSATENSWEIDNVDWEDVSVLSVLDRLINLNIIFHGKSSSNFVDISSGFGIVETNNGEYIRYNNGRVWGPGQRINTAATISEVKDTMANGVAYQLSRPLIFTNENIGAFLESNNNYREFFRYLEKSANSVLEGAESQDDKSRMNYDPETKTIPDIPLNDVHTYLIPNKAAIDQAVADGLLPEIGRADFTQAEQEMVNRFLKFHVLRRRIISPNQGYNDVAYTNYKDNDGDTYVSIDSNTENKLIIYDRKGRRAEVTATGTSAHTNVLANRAIIHLIDNYLDYRAEIDDGDE